GVFLWVAGGLIACGGGDSGGSPSSPEYFLLYQQNGQPLLAGYQDPSGTDVQMNWQSIIECIQPPYINGDEDYGVSDSPGPGLPTSLEKLTAANCRPPMFDQGACGTQAPFGAEYYLTDQGASGPKITCAKSSLDGPRTFQFPAGIFTIKEQVWVAPTTTIVGAKPVPFNGTDPAEKTAALNESEYTLFVAGEGYKFPTSSQGTNQAPVTASNASSFPFCDANTLEEPLSAKYGRIGFLMHNDTTAQDFVFQGNNLARPLESSNLCGGGAFETPGCISGYGGMDGGTGCYNANNGTLAGDQISNVAYPDSTKWITGGYVDVGSTGGAPPVSLKNITIKNIRLNDPRLTNKEGARSVDVIQASPEEKAQWGASQLAVYVAPTPDGSYVDNVLVSNVSSITTTSDGLNLRYVYDALVENVVVANSGDDGLALWADQKTESRAVFRNVSAVYSGARGQGNGNDFYQYGQCFAVYGIGELTVDGLSCWDRRCEEPPSDPNVVPCLPSPAVNNGSVFNGRNGAHAVIFNDSGWYEGSYTNNPNDITINGLSWFSWEENGGTSSWTSVQNFQTPPSGGNPAGRTYCYSQSGDAKFTGSGDCL
ncbi:MAG: hypothetical protein CBC48_18420, partial [bacterium TMED88]